jgi:Holliday junction resolvasome RuvABC ATP-dependent DNA helicase subunit
MVNSIKKQGKSLVVSMEKKEKDIPSVTEDEIDTFIKNQQAIPNKTINGKDIDEFDEFEQLNEEKISLNREDLEKMIFDYIEKNDEGDGVNINKIASNIGIDKKIVDDVIKKLCINMKIYSITTGKYQIYKKKEK